MLWRYDVIIMFSPPMLFKELSAIKFRENCVKQFSNFLKAFTSTNWHSSNVFLTVAGIDSRLKYGVG